MDPARTVGENRKPRDGPVAPRVLGPSFQKKAENTVTR